MACINWGHNRENFGTMFKSIIGNFKGVIGSGLVLIRIGINWRACSLNDTPAQVVHGDRILGNLD